MPQKVTTFDEVHRLLEALPGSTKSHLHSLEPMQELLDFVGHPERRLRVVHVAGTSGKSSTACYIAALLGACGQKVGLTVSPHVNEVNERVQIGLTPLPEAEFCRRFSEFLELIEPCRIRPSYFELFVAFALWEFAARKVDYAVVEVGIGGLLDSTNVFDDAGKVCVITDIGYDHMPLLGDTLAEIAGQKAGIIQLHNVVFCHRQGEEVMGAIEAQARRKQADLHMRTADTLGSEFDFLPFFQRRNFGLALDAAQFVAERDGLGRLDSDDVARAAHTRIPGRMETIRRGRQTIVLDIAHNGQKLDSLIASIHAKYPGQAVAALMRMPVRQASLPRTVEGLGVAAKGLQHITMTSLAEGGVSDDSFSTEKLREVFRRAGYSSFELIADPRAAFAALTARPEPILLVTGSTFLLNHVRPLLGPDRPA